MWWWLRFCNCDEQNPSQHVFLGACIVKGHDLAEASRQAFMAGCHPGGTASGLRIADPIVRVIPYTWRQVLLSKADCDAFEALMPFEGDNVYALPSARLERAKEWLG